MTQVTPESPAEIIFHSKVEFIGLLVIDAEGVRNFFTVECPCGVKARYPLNGFPEVDTPHPCGNPKHWVVKYPKTDPADAMEAVRAMCKGTR